MKFIEFTDPRTQVAFMINIETIISIMPATNGSRISVPYDAYQVTMSYTDLKALLVATPTVPTAH